MDCLRKSDSIIVTIVDRVEQLHEDVAEDVKLLKALLIYAKRLDYVSAFATFCVFFVDLTGHPVVRWNVIVDVFTAIVDHVGQIGEL